jgi:hypothetical protein
MPQIKKSEGFEGKIFRVIAYGSVAGICKYFDSLVFLPGVGFSHCGR